MTDNVQKITLLHTNDIHSHFEEMPKIVSLLQRLRAGLDEHCVCTLDVGDHMDRMRIETEGTNGLANIAVMNETGYEAAVPGNNEGLTFTKQALAEAYGKHAGFPVVCSNLLEPETGAPPAWMLRYTLLRKGELTIGIFGLTARFTEFYSLLGWDIIDPFRAAAETIALIGRQADIVVALSHLGYANDQRLAAEVPGIDVILGGHTHHLLPEPVRIGDTYICAAGKHGQYVGEVDIWYDTANRNVRSVSGRCHPVREEKAAPEMARLISEHRTQGEKALSRVIATLEQPLPIEWERESGLGNLLAIGVRRWTESEIGLVNAGQLLGSLCAGDVTKETLLQICPSPINPCRMRLTGEQIVRALEESLLPEFIDKALMGFGFRGKRLGTLCLDGLTVSYAPDAEPYRKIREVIVNGEPLEEQRVYTVGTLDMFTFRVGYLSLSEGQDVSYCLPEFIRDVLEEQLRDKEALIGCREPRWRPL
ncbi:bifunctional metallophosphatase/5'-nucleotidase [Paenibacillus sp. MBLB4367]|uniref:bifunctional metallophosphatase/5'-nucleotidase n=1 Tax=Paenibacillus sp. MBLB4367 TaxID=3384767 RepID=UPI00390844FE